MGQLCRSSGFRDGGTGGLHMLSAGACHGAQGGGRGAGGGGREAWGPGARAAGGFGRAGGDERGARGGSSVPGSSPPQRAERTVSRLGRRLAIRQDMYLTGPRAQGETRGTLQRTCRRVWYLPDCSHAGGHPLADPKRPTGMHQHKEGQAYESIET